MNHKWKNNVCVRCGIQRKAKRARKVIYLYPMLDGAGNMYDKPATKVMKLWNYGTEHGFQRPDCPDEIAA